MTENKSEKDNAIIQARRVILAESESLVALADSLVGAKADAFNAAVTAISECQGHLIVVGVGKSGHIGQKLAASFASTGTPSFFMHPTEASHGDLGMVTTSSVVLAISSSGESQELANVLGYCRRLSVPVIAITQKSDSSLSRNSTIVLEIPEREEACVNGLAPTTSTTMTLALGDALVVAVMDRRNFTPEDFGRRHPGGKLGRRLQKIRDWIAENAQVIPRVSLDTSAQDLILAMTKGQNGCVAVMDEASIFAGIITDGDLRRAMSPGIFDLAAKDLMTAGGVSFDPEQTMGEAIDLLFEKKIGVAFVLENGRPIGLINTKTLALQGYI